MSFQYYHYPKVWNLGHPAVADIFSDPVLVQEKIDGSQFSFGMIEGELRCWSKGAVIQPDAPEGMFDKAVETANSLASILIPNVVYRCEYLRKPKHNTLKYDRVPDRNLIIFDINTGPDTYMGQFDVVAEAMRLNMESVCNLGTMQPRSVDDVKHLLQQPSALGGTTVEGIVFKNYTRFGRDGKVLMAKLVSDAFREKHGKDWKLCNPSHGDIIQQIGDSLRTEARWNKAVQHLAEMCQLESSPRDIGTLIKLLVQDTAAEEQDQIKEALWKYAWPKIQRIVRAGFPEWYKERLLNNQFPGKSE